MYRLVRDGVGLNFVDVCRGAPALVLVHDLACDHTSFTPQIEHFRQCHRVVGVDLRGHGQSDKPEQEYTVSGLADDLAWLCYELGVYRPIVVGHGLGGAVGLELSARNPDIPSAIVALNSHFFPPPEAHDSLLSFANRLRAPTWSEELRRWVEQALPIGMDSRHRARALAAVSLIPRQAATSTLGSVLAWNCARAAVGCRVPALYLDAGTGAADLEQLRGLCPQLSVGKVKGSGHFQHLELPEQVNGMIDDFLASLIKPSI